MEISELDVPGYETVVHALDPATGLDAYVAIHSTRLGPACGGMRLWPYGSREEAFTDVLRLAEGMTYKSAVARTGLGGGKSVVIGDAATHRTPELLQAMGRFIDTLGGRYITAEDVNIRVEDLREVRKSTRWVSGLSREEGGSGNPSPFTGEGVYLGIVACCERVFGARDMSDRHVAFQGVGAVAAAVIDRCIEAGARVTACDIKQHKIDRIRERHPSVEWVAPDTIYDVPCDVFAPHALGAVINDATVGRLQCRVVAGAANNQLAEVRHGQALVDRGILYAPDFVINAGGIINISVELDPGGYDEEAARAKIANIPRALHDIFDIAEKHGVPTNEAAREVARRNLEEG